MKGTLSYLGRSEVERLTEGLSLSDGCPIALFTAAFPLARLPGIGEALARETSVTSALRRATCTTTSPTTLRTTPTPPR